MGVLPFDKSYSWPRTPLVSGAVSFDVAAAHCNQFATLRSRCVLRLN